MTQEREKEEGGDGERDSFAGVVIYPLELFRFFSSGLKPGFIRLWEAHCAFRMHFVWHLKDHVFLARNIMWLYIQRLNDRYRNNIRNCGPFLFSSSLLQPEHVIFQSSMMKRKLQTKPAEMVGWSLTCASTLDLAMSSAFVQAQEP